MLGGIARKLFGTKNDRSLKRMGYIVKRINEYESQLEQLTNVLLQKKTAEFKEKLKNKVPLDDILPEAFAVVREAGKRALQMRHFDCQLIGGITLHEGRIAEMRTGEGKTLVATLPAYLNALTGKGVHIVTVNDYLAKRDAEWMKPLFKLLGLHVGVVFSGQGVSEKREAYACDVTYGTNNEFGFDYLRDNMALSLTEKTQRHLHFAIVDEVDSILIDEARTPLIISGPSEDSSDLYRKIDSLIPLITKESEEEDYYIVDEKHRQVELTETGHQWVEELMVKHGLLNEGESLYTPNNLILLHHLNAGLKAHLLFSKDVDYIVQRGQIVIVDEHTGRTMPGRRWSEGIHQSVEAKEGLKIQSENQTLASTTFQNYFRQYEKLAGMTGTADTEAFEFQQIYGLDVIVIPTNKPMVRIDHDDVIFLTQEEKFTAIIEDIKECVAEGRPVLVGTISIETSEYLSTKLRKARIKHKVLNAKFHQKEAEIVAQAGQSGHVTIATNMAGRGTDIVLGGNWQAEIAQLKKPTHDAIEKLKQQWHESHGQVLQAGGLHIIGTSRHESRRIDNQLRGRAGRQGDPGSTRFYLSMEDSLLRIFASDGVKAFMQKLGMEKDEAIEHRWVTRSIENAQKKVEGRNFDIRKSLLEYDDVANDQRQVIYQQRNQLLTVDDVSETIHAIRKDVFNQLVSSYIPEQSIVEEWDLPGLTAALSSDFSLTLPIEQWVQDEHLNQQALTERIIEMAELQYQEKEERLGDTSTMRLLEKQILLHTLDRLWKDHLANMDFLRQGIHLRGYAQSNPKQEYKKEAFIFFQELLETIKYDTVSALCAVQVASEEEVTQMEEQHRQRAETQKKQQKYESSEQEKDSEEETNAPFQRETEKVGRNQPCPCGSGKKFKHCHGLVSH